MTKIAFSEEEFYPVYTIADGFCCVEVELTYEELDRFNKGMLEYHAVQSMIAEKIEEMKK